MIDSPASSTWPENTVKAHIIWSGLLTIMTLALVMPAHRFSSTAVFACLIHLVSWLLLTQKPWALWTNLLTLMGVFLFTAPFVLKNLWAWALGTELFKDSPGTLLVLLIFTITVTLPSAVFSFRYLLWWLKRSRS